MRVFSKAVLCSAIGVVLAATALADDAKAAKAKPDAKHGAKSAAVTTMTPDQLTWTTNPGDAAVKVAVVWGDMEKGPHGAFHKFPAGWASGLHRHSADMKLVIVSGTLIQGTEDGKETKLPPGSYAFQPHTAKHVTKCDAGSECVIFVVASGKFDLIPADAGKSAPKK